MAEVEFHLHNEVGIKFPPLRPAYTDGELYFDRFRGLVARSTGSSMIGEGGTGRIHLVRDELMEREVALKIPLESILRDPAAREDIIEETRQAMELTHPNIVRIHDFHEGGGRWGISMQYVRGKNLDEWRYNSESTGFRRAIRPYTVEAIRDWIAQLCDALRYAHEDARMVHRDIKPKNLMLEKREGGEKVFITDFGISQRLRQHTMMLSRDQSKASESKGNMGTLPYMPWEQISGAPASPLDDIYAVGATIYELITGRPPFYDGGFEQIKVQIREMTPPSMEKRILDLGLHMPPPPEEWEQVAAACLAKRPEDRPQSIRAVAAALGFQAGSNTELEAKVSTQAERINELETQIITLSTNTAPVNHEAAAQLQATKEQLAKLQQEITQAQVANEQLAKLQQELTQAQDEIHSLEEIVKDARTKEAEAQALLQSTTAERDAALQGGDAALRQFQEDSAKRIALAEANLGKLQKELDAVKAAGDARVQQAQQAAQQKITDLEAALQRARQESGQMVATATEKLKREVDQANESLRKSEEAREKAVRLAREEGEKRLQTQATELEKTRQSLAKVVEQKELIERALATEKERLSASLRPLLVSLLIAMVLGLGGGLTWSLMTKKKSPNDGLSAGLIAYLPIAEDQVTDKPVPYDQFKEYAEIEKIPLDEKLNKGADGAILGINGITAMNFCNWLTDESKRKDGLCYTLPDIDDFAIIKGKVTKGNREWSKTWAPYDKTNPENNTGMVFQMMGDKEKFPSVHILQANPEFTFRIKLEKLVKPEKTK